MTARTTLRLLSLGLLGALVWGCAGSRPAPSTILDARFETEEAERANERAPDLYAAAARARAAARASDAAGRRGVAEDHASRARLLLDAAIAEAERLELEEARLSVEAEEAELEVAHRESVARREEILTDVRHQEASRVAMTEAAAAFAQATEDEGRRYRGRTEERAALHREAAGVLARRARMLVSVATAEGAEAGATDPVTALLSRAEGTNDPARKLALTEEAVRGAMRALGTARQQRPGPTTDERAALIEAAREAGLGVEQRSQGLTVVASNVFASGGAAPSAAGSRRLRLVAALISAHPHGSVIVTAFGTGGSEGARTRQSTARANRALRVLTEAGAPEARTTAAPSGDAPEAELVSRVEVTFAAYGPEVR